MRHYPVYQPSLTGNEKKYVTDCLDSTWISSKGEYIQRFEAGFADFIGVRFAATVCNGTAALHLALLALGIGEGDEVIVPTLTYIASVNAIKYCGATPVFVDSTTDTWQIDVSDVERKITKNTKAVMAVHLYGHPCDMIQLQKLCKCHDIFLVEDCAEAIGSRQADRHVGTFGDIATFSFFGNKTITTGEGGMVVTNNETLNDRVKHIRGQGLALHRQYWHDIIGYNYRMTNICAAIGLAQLEQVESFLTKKRVIANWYKDGLSDLPVTFHQESPGYTNSYWMCSILVENSNDRDKLREHLDQAGIETRPLFYPVHTMPMYADKYECHPVAENLGWRGINIPSYPGLDKEDVDYIIDAIKSFFND